MVRRFEIRSACAHERFGRGAFLGLMLTGMKCAASVGLLFALVRAGNYAQEVHQSVRERAGAQLTQLGLASDIAFARTFCEKTSDGINHAPGPMPNEKLAR